MPPVIPSQLTEAHSPPQKALNVEDSRPSEAHIRLLIEAFASGKGPKVLSSFFHGESSTSYPSTETWKNGTPQLSVSNEMWERAFYISFANEQKQDEPFMLYCGQSFDASERTAVTDESLNCAVKSLAFVFQVYADYGVSVPSFALYTMEIEEKAVEVMLISFAGLRPFVEEPLPREKKEALAAAISGWFDLDFLLGFTERVSLQTYLTSMGISLSIDQKERLVRVPLATSAFTSKPFPDVYSQELVEASFIRIFGPILQQLKLGREFAPDIVVDLAANITKKALPLVLQDALKITFPQNPYEEYIAAVARNVHRAKTMLSGLAVLKPHYTASRHTKGLTKEEATEVVRARKDHAFQTYRAVIPVHKQASTADGFLLILRTLWYRYAATDLERAALQRLLKAHEAPNGHIDQNECWKVFLAALRYLVLSPSIRDLVHGGYVMVFVDSNLGSNQVDQALTHGIKYPAGLRFRSSFKNDPDAPSLQLTCPLMSVGGKSTRKHIGFVIRDDGRLHTFERGAKSIDPALIKEDFEDWFENSEPQPVSPAYLDYTLVNEKGRFIYIKALVHATNPKQSIPGYQEVRESLLKVDSLNANPSLESKVGKQDSPVSTLSTSNSQSTLESPSILISTQDPANQKMANTAELSVLLNPRVTVEPLYVAIPLNRSDLVSRKADPLEDLPKDEELELDED